MGALVDVDELRVQGRLEVDGVAVLGGQLEALELLPLLAAVDHVPDLDLHDVVGRLVVPLDGGDADLVGRGVGFDEAAALKL